MRLQKSFFFISIILSFNLLAETIASIKIQNCKMDRAYTLNGHSEIMERTWQDVCRIIGLPPTDIPGGEFCVTPAGNPVYVQPGDLCSNGDFKIPVDFGWCDEPIASCPNPSWTLSEDNETCFRPDFSCWIKIDSFTEEKLLAGITYGESSTLNNYKEMAAIAYAVIRRRDAARKPSVGALVKAYPSFSYVISDGSPRFRKLMCSETEEGFEKPFRAARNALNKGVDYANGGCFWDGDDLKKKGIQAYRYKQGFRFTNSKHNLFNIPEPSPRNITTAEGKYNYEYESVAAYGKTIFWKLNHDFMKAKGVKQCH